MQSFVASSGEQELTKLGLYSEN